MSKQSDAVKTWRQRTKDRIVDAMGGKCYCCEYIGCAAVFDLHHIDPITKHFSLGGVRANPVAWSKIVEELRKCILVCANCHREIENGYRIVENPKSTFDESFVEYTIGTYPRQRGKMHDVRCKSCDVPCIVYSLRQKYCSDVCRKIDTRRKLDLKNRVRQRPRKTVWPTREELDEKMATETWVAIAREYGVSDNAVRKWAKSYKLI